MKCEYIVQKSLYLFIILFGIAKGEACYKAEFSEDVWECADFKNDHLRCVPLELGMVEKEDGGLGLNGAVNVTKEIEKDTMMNVEVWKIMDIGKEYLYHAQGDICSSLQDENTPWFPLVNSMDISSCPIAVKTYEIKDMILNLDGVKDVMTHEACGDYLIQMKMEKGLDEISCHELSVTVSEYEC